MRSTPSSDLVCDALKVGERDEESRGRFGQVVSSLSMLWRGPRELAESRQLLAWLWQENERLAGEIGDLQEETKELDAQVDYLTDLNGQLEDDNRRFRLERRRVDNTAGGVGQAEAAIPATAQSNRAATCLQSLEDVVDVLRMKHADKLSFTPRALASARTASFHDVEKACRCIEAVATTLHRLVFETGYSLGKIADAFRNETGFELAVTERNLTKRGKRFTAQRRDTYKGMPIDITAHVKCNGPGHTHLRVHYGVDREKKLIVIGHCGDHLETSGTKRIH